jgi:hypothetical protein
MVLMCSCITKKLFKIILNLYTCILLYRDHVGFCVIVTFSSIHKLKWPVLLSYLWEWNQTWTELAATNNYWEKCYEHLGTNGRTEVKQYTGGIIKLLWHMIMHGSVIRTKFQVCKLQLKHRWRERHQQQMNISSDLGNRHPVIVDHSNPS